MNVTKIGDARTMKELGWPLNTPVVDRVMSRATTTHYTELVKAYSAFEQARKKYVCGNGPTLAKWKCFKNRLAELEQATMKAHDFMRSNSQYDDHSMEALSPIVDRIASFIYFWREAIESLNNGNPVTIRPGDVPIVFDDN